jgi:hypothetical protein
MPLFLHPWALIGLAAVPVLVLVYFLRNRFRPWPVASLMLWRLPAQPRTVGARRERLRLPWLFWLELLVLVLLVLAATSPDWNIRRGGRPLIVVLDDSVSMRARSGGTTARERALRFLEQRLRQERHSPVRLILAGSTPRTLEGTGADVRSLRQRLEAWRCEAPASDLARAIGLATEWSRNQADVLVLTDQPPPEGLNPGEGLVWYAAGQRVANAGFVGAARTTAGERDRCFLEVLNGGTGTHQTELVIRVGTEVWDRKELSLAPGQRHRWVFNVPADAPVVTAVLGSDGLEEDNTVWLAPPPRRMVSVALALTNVALKSLVERTLQATGLYRPATQVPDLVIHEGAARAWPARTWTVEWLDPEEPVLFAGPFLPDRTHPLMEGLTLQGVLWAGGRQMEAPDLVPILLAGNVPLIAERAAAQGARHLTFAYDLEHSTLHESPDWPILFWNLLHWRGSRLPGLRDTNVRRGAEVAVVHEGRGVTVQGPDGWQWTADTGLDPCVFVPPRAGLYRVNRGGEGEWLAVNLLAEGETNLSGCDRGVWGTWRVDVRARQESAPSSTWLGLLACVCVLGHLYGVLVERRGAA